METKVNGITLDFDKFAVLSANVHVLHRPGAVRLDEYPLLVYAPLQESHGHPAFNDPHDPFVHGPMIRTEDGKATVAEICIALGQTPDLEAVAAQFGTSEEHVLQAAAYAIAHVHG